MMTTAILYAVLMPFLSALAPTTWLPLPLILIATVTPILLFSRRLRALKACWQRDIGFVMVFLLGALAILGSPSGIGEKTANYTFAVLVSYVFFFVMTRELLYSVRGGWHTVARAATWSLTILSIAVLIEFYLASWHNVFLADLIPFAHDDLEAAFLLNENFRRPRAFAAEPGFTAVAYECLWPLTWIGAARLHNSLGWRARQALYVGGFLVLASAAAVGCLAAAAFAVWLIRSRDLKRLLRMTLPMVLLLGMLLSTGWGDELLWGVFGRKLDLFGVVDVDQADAVTALVRLSRLETGIELLLQYPMGIGWGGVAQAFTDQTSLGGISAPDGSGLINLYLDLAVAAGLASIPAMLVFVGVRWRSTLRSANPVAPFLATALIAVCLHHLFITEFQMPFLWFVLALADCLWMSERGRRRTARKSSLHRTPQHELAQANA